MVISFSFTRAAARQDSGDGVSTRPASAHVWVPARQILLISGLAPSPSCPLFGYSAWNKLIPDHFQSEAHVLCRISLRWEEV